MDLQAHHLLRLHGFLVDAYSVDELARLVEQWDRQVATMLPNPRTSAVQDYVHLLVTEVWRRRRWIGKGGLLFHIARVRTRRLREIVALATALEGFAEDASPAPPRPPAAAPGQATQLRATGVRGQEVVHEEVLYKEIVAASTVDVLALIRTRLRVRRDEFWVASAGLYHHLVSDQLGAGRLLLTFAGRGVAVEAWPYLVQDGRILPHARVEVRASTIFHYCPHGRAHAPEFRLTVAPGSCSLSGRDGAVRHVLQLVSSSAVSNSKGEM